MTPAPVADAQFAIGDDTLNDPYVPAVFVLDAELGVRAAYNGYWYWERPTIDGLVTVLHDLTRMLRPDWAAQSRDALLAGPR